LSRIKEENIFYQLRCFSKDLSNPECLFSLELKLSGRRYKVIYLAPGNYFIENKKRRSVAGAPFLLKG
jgi:hypothetical protein